MGEEVLTRLGNNTGASAEVVAGSKAEAVTEE